MIISRKPVHLGVESGFALFNPSDNELISWAVADKLPRNDYLVRK